MTINKHYLNKFLNLTVLTTITVMSWIFFDIYRTVKKNVIPKVLTEQLEPVNPNFDQQTIDMLKQRLTYSQQELDNTPDITVINASPVPISLPKLKEASEAGNPVANP